MFNLNQGKIIFLCPWLMALHNWRPCERRISQRRQDALEAQPKGRILVVLGGFAQWRTSMRLLVLTLVEDLVGCSERPGLGRGGREAANHNQWWTGSSSWIEQILVKK